ncbi:S8 family serine peptidase [Solirubrobacter taibaiensis]|nr:S8 family serine peptidase [Solirubrobacter taibaiensis]
MRLAVLFAVLFLATPAAAEAAEGDIIVVREPGADAREVRQDAEVRLVKPLSIERAELVEPRDGDVASALAELRADDDVLAADVDSVVTVADAAQDAFYPTMWGLRNIFTADAWELSEGAGVSVGVVDTGVQADHEDLAGQVVGGYDVLSRGSVAQDINGHGTHVAGTIAALANNNKGIIGVAPSAKVVPLRALDDGGSGYMSDVAAAFDYAGDQGLRIVNASLAGGYAAVLETVIAQHPDTLYVVAAGNDGKDNDQPAQATYPCALPQPNILCVAANDSRDNIAWFSNFGATTVDISAPGMGIRSTVPNNRYESKNGTSMAAPHVAGAAALALAANPSATTSQLKWALLSTVDAASAFVGKSTTAGRLNASAAVAAILGPLPEPEPIAARVEPAAPVETPTPAPEVPTAPPTAPPVAETPVSPPAPVVPAPVTPAPQAAARLIDVKVGGSLKGATSKLRVTFKLTQSAAVRFTVTAKGKSFGTWTRQAHRGGNQFTLTRKLPTGKTLKRGRYTLSVALSGSAKASSASIRVP